MSQRRDGQLSLPTCALPNCQVPVGAWGQVCTGCAAEFGDYLVRCERDPDLSEEQIAEMLAARDDGVRAAYAAQAAIAASAACDGGF